MLGEIRNVKTFATVDRRIPTFFVLCFVTTNLFVNKSDIKF